MAYELMQVKSVHLTINANQFVLIHHRTSLEQRLKETPSNNRSQHEKK